MQSFSTARTIMAITTSITTFLILVSSFSETTTKAVAFTMLSPPPAAAITTTNALFVCGTQTYLTGTSCRRRMKYQNKAFSPLQPSLPFSTRIQRNTNIQKTTTTSLSMSLIPIPASTLTTLLSTGIPTGAQYASYWGKTSRERYNAAFESATVTILGMFASYFLSFILGNLVATMTGTMFAFWTLLGPELKAYQRNWELRGGRELVDPWMDDDDYDYNDYDDDDYYEDEYNYPKRKKRKRTNLPPENERGLYGAYYFGSITSISIVENINTPPDSPTSSYPITSPEFTSYTMENDEMESLTGLPWNVRLSICDTNDRCLQIHARMSEEYLRLREGMSVATVLLSTSRNFDTLAAITDVCVPEAECWVGDYPYLERSEFERMIVEEGLWEVLQREGYYWEDGDDDDGDDGFYDDGFYDDD